MTVWDAAAGSVSREWYRGLCRWPSDDSEIRRVLDWSRKEWHA